MVQHAARALETYEAIAGQLPRMTDKMPTIYLTLGLVAILFPNAKLVHVHRNPMDVCVSNYTTMFARGHAQTTDLAHLAATWSDHRTLMDHWAEVLPTPIHQVEYEALVHDPEAVTRTLLDHCELTWDPSCLDFHQNPRVVTTASRDQVPQPISTRRIGVWRRYEPHLDDLRSAHTEVGAPVS